MQPDELEAQHCRKVKNAMAKSPKSRCCKVDTVKVKSLTGGDLFDCVPLFPTMQDRYLYPGTNPTPSRSRHCLLAPKDKNY
jgi:hypothetical protein